MMTAMKPTMKRMIGASIATICSTSMSGVTAFALKQADVAAPIAKNVHTPVGKDGEGEYTAATKGCFDVIEAASPLVLREVATQPIREGQAFHVADYGTADAGTSLGLLSNVVRAVRERKDAGEKEVVIHYEDQLNNEWKSVFNHALGYKKVTDAYNREIDTPYNLGGVFVEANGVGFHQQSYATGSIDLGVSFTAMHWLSSSPSSLKGSPEYMHSARCPDGPPEGEKLQANEDWYNILQARSKELTTGGRFVCVNFCVSKEGYFLGQTDVGSSMWDSFQSSWDKLAADGIISEAEQSGVSFPNYYRTTEEFLAGIERCSDLKLITAEEKIVRCPYREQFVKGKNDMSPEEYAKSFVPVSNGLIDHRYQSITSRIIISVIPAHFQTKCCNSHFRFFPQNSSCHQNNDRQPELGPILLSRLDLAKTEPMTRKKRSSSNSGPTTKIWSPNHRRLTAWTMFIPIWSLKRCNINA